ncbi:MAG: RdgB/HAM1 family non-canonical purine NTP pyrophosphatase [Devosiaceae bacterium]|nr:RdgB/HAM1 family non-canonical purine NTP pyrophosphatase [Devosiaceae bacterium]
MRKLIEKSIVVASHNEGKVREINALIGPFGFNAKSAKELGLSEPVEDGDTFEANALIKARAAVEATNLPALSDDSGLCVDALGGEPGVYTADWAEKEDGSGRDFLMAMEKVEAALQEKEAHSPQQRTARFVAVLCMAWPDGHHEFFRGEVEGHLVWPPRGKSGFGYDPVFMPQGQNRTFSEMSAVEKHGETQNFEAGRADLGLSHRSRAFAKFARQCLIAE